MKSSDVSLVISVWNRVADLRENLAAASPQKADPNEVSDLIFECATADTPVHNPVGADARMLLDMKASMPHEEFLGRIAEMLVPASG